MRKYGDVLMHYASIIPDGIVSFFSSYMYMEQIISTWHVARNVIVNGVPGGRAFQYTESRVLGARLEYMRSSVDIRERD